MITTLRFILFFLMAPTFAVIAQPAGGLQDDFRIVDAGFRANSVILDSIEGEICNYDSSGALLQQRRSLGGKAADEDGLYRLGGLEATGAERPLFSITAELVAAKRLPQGLSASQFDDAARLLRGGAGNISDDIVVQGSRASGAARATSDIDFAIRVSPEQFNQLIVQRFGAAKLGTAKGRTMLHAIETGKIQAGEAGLGGLRRQLQRQLGIDVDLSIIQRGGPFDNGVTLPVP